MVLQLVRRTLARRGVQETIDLPGPPRLLSASAERGVRAVLRRRHASCLEGALVMQRWYSAHGVEKELVIGVTSPNDAFAAHAWLEPRDDSTEPAEEFTELLRASHQVRR